MEKTVLKNDQLSIFCGSMAVMLRSGVSMHEALELFAGTGATASENAAGYMSGEMLKGSSFSDAAKASGAFPDYALGMFRNAELSGHLDDVLEHLEAYYERQDDIRKCLSFALVYPAVLLLMMCGVMAILMFTVLPMFAGVYKSLTGSMLASGYSCVLASGVIGKLSLVLCALAAAVLIVFICMSRSENGSKRIRPLLEKMSFTKDAMEKLELSKLADTLSIMLSSGAGASEALAHCRALIKHGVLKEKLDRCSADLDNYESLESSLYRRAVFPPVYGRILLSGSKSGSLDSAFQTIAERTGKEAGDSLKELINRTEPVLIGFLTVSVGLTLLSVMLPLLGILTAL